MQERSGKASFSRSSTAQYDDLPPQKRCALNSDLKGPQELTVSSLVSSAETRSVEVMLIAYLRAFFGPLRAPSQSLSKICACR